MYKSGIVAFMAGLLLVGCASPYQPTERQLALKGGYDESEAVAVIASAAEDFRRATKSGLCYVSVNRDSGSSYSVDKAGLHFAAWTRGDFVKEENNYKYYEKDPYTAHFLYKDITEIVYQDNTDGAALGCVADYLISTGSEAGTMTFGMPRDRLDPLMGALMKLAPQAELKEQPIF